MPPSRLRDLIEAHVKTLSATASSRHTCLLVAALQESLRRAVERDRFADELAAQTAELQRLMAKVLHLEAWVKDLEASPGADVVVPGEAPPGWSLVYYRKSRSVLITRPDGVQSGLEVYPAFWPDEFTGAVRPL